MKVFFRKFGLAQEVLFLAVCAGVLFVLWLPGTQFPVVSDTLRYADMGKSMWTTWTYTIKGVPASGQLPLHAFLSYPLTVFLGIDLGMHLSTFLGGSAVLIMTYVLLSRIAGKGMAALTTLAVLFHPAFILMTQLGSADLLFTTVCLAAVLSYLCAESNPHLYILTGLFTGLACLTRYNGLPLIPFFFLWTFFFRSKHRYSPWIWSGILIAVLLASMWFIRNYITFGNPLHSDYVGELAQEAPNPVVQFFRNILYYGNPIHNVFLFLFPFTVYGLVRYARTYTFMICAMLTLWIISSIWWVQAMRFFFPGYPFLLFFGVLGLCDMFTWARGRLWLISLLIVVGLGLQLTSICVYTYGACNAFFDSTVGIIPPNLGLTPEGFYAWGKARDAINQTAASGALVYSARPDVEGRHFRANLRLTSDESECPLHIITQRPETVEGHQIFATESSPLTYVVLRDCPTVRR